MKNTQTLSAMFSFPGFLARSRLQGIFGDAHARLVTVVRRKKPPRARALELGTGPSTTAGRAEYGTPMLRASVSTWRLSNGGQRARAVRG